MTPPDFEMDLQRALAATQPCVHQDIIGFRAPSFSITQNTLWAIDVLAFRGCHVRFYTLPEVFRLLCQAGFRSYDVEPIGKLYCVTALA